MDIDRDLPSIPGSRPKSPTEPSHHRPRRSYSTNEQSRDRERFPSSARELARLLVLEQRERQELKMEMNIIYEQLRAEKHRADEAERRLQETIARLKALNESRLAAVQNAKMATESLTLYKAQLAVAQGEIDRAQSVFNIVDHQRYEAEKEAAKARTQARKLNEEKLWHTAMEEGRRLGMQEGLQQGREFGFEEGRMTGYAQAQANVQDTFYEPDEEEGRRTPSFARQDQDDLDFDAYSPAPTQQSHHVLPNQPPVPMAERPPMAPPSQHASPQFRPITEIHPTIVHNTTSHPRHAPVVVPPDGYIPQVGPDSIISLPPPHEMSPQPFPTTGAPLPPISHNEVPVISRPLSTASQARRQVLPTSNSAALPRVSLHEGIRPHVPHVPLDFMTEVNQRPESVRAESLRRMPSLTRSAHGTPAPVEGFIPHPAAGTADTDHYAQYQSSPAGLRSSRSIASSLNRPASARSRPVSVSSHSTAPGITVLPPSRPASYGSPSQSGSPLRNFLGPADADRPIPEPTRSLPPDIDFGPEPIDVRRAIPVADPGRTTTPVILANDQLPPGFVPMGFTPAHSEAPLPPSGHNSMPGSYGFSSMGTPGRPPVDPFEVDSQSTHSSEFQTSEPNTLTTPPEERRPRLPRDLAVDPGISQFTGP